MLNIHHEYPLPLFIIKVYTTTLLKRSSNFPPFFSPSSCHQACSVVADCVHVFQGGPDPWPPLPHPSQWGHGVGGARVPQGTLSTTTSAFLSLPQSPSVPVYAFTNITKPGAEFSQQIVGWNCSACLSVTVLRTRWQIL